MKTRYGNDSQKKKNEECQKLGCASALWQPCCQPFPDGKERKKSDSQLQGLQQQCGRQGQCCLCRTRPSGVKEGTKVYSCAQGRQGHCKPLNYQTKRIGCSWPTQESIWECRENLIHLLLITWWRDIGWQEGSSYFTKCRANWINELSPTPCW